MSAINLSQSYLYCQYVPADLLNIIFEYADIYEIEKLVNMVKLQKHKKSNIKYIKSKVEAITNEDEPIADWLKAELNTFVLTQNPLHWSEGVWDAFPELDRLSKKIMNIAEEEERSASKRRERLKVIVPYNG